MLLCTKMYKISLSQSPKAARIFSTYPESVLTEKSYETTYFG